jgi:hypothetical protein
LDFAAILSNIQNFWLIFLVATLDYLRSPLGDVSVEILQKKNYNAILVFGHHFGFISWLTILSIKYEYFLTQSSLQNGKMFTYSFSKIFFFELRKKSIFYFPMLTQKNPEISKTRTTKVVCRNNEQL